jgi:hypothetical protein
MARLGVGADYPRMSATRGAQVGKHGRTGGTERTSRTGAAERPRRVWATFASWHRYPDFYRDIYAHTVATTVVAFLVYVGAALAGLVTRKPLLVISAVALAASLVWLVVTIAKVAPIWRHVRPLFRVWNDDTSPEALRAKELYGSLYWSFLATLFSAGFLAAALFAR